MVIMRSNRGEFMCASLRAEYGLRTAYCMLCRSHTDSRAA